MTSRVIPVAPFVLTVFGATSDLTRRKLLPALIHRDFSGQLPEAAIIVGAARRAMSRDAFIALARDASSNTSRLRKPADRSSIASWRGCSSSRSMPRARTVGPNSPE